jgi:molybdopterin converting factor small subunit
LNRRVELYGRLRDSGHGDHVMIELSPNATARQALEALKKALGRRGALVKGCCLATEGDVLLPDDIIPKTGRLAALPPVCGG